MATALTLEQYLARHETAYDVLTHALTMSSLRTAQASHVSADDLAKAVVLKNGGGYFIAVLPASHHLEMHTLGQNVALATEEEIAWLFPDCVPGAVPAIGEAYGLNTVVDDRIAEQPDIFFEGGDHATLVHMSGPAFCQLMTDAHALRGRFSSHA